MPRKKTSALISTLCQHSLVHSPECITRFKVVHGLGVVSVRFKIYSNFLIAPSLLVSFIELICFYGTRTLYYGQLRCEVLFPENIT